MLDNLTFQNKISLIYGPPASGKTTLCHQIAANAKGKVLFLDTENTFYVEKLQQINPQIDLDNIIVIPVRRFSEQFKAIKALTQMKNISLVIIDSFTKYYRVKLSDKIVIKPITMRMLRMLKGLRVPVILTSQVYEMDDKVKPVGSDLFYKFADYEIYLEYKDEQRTLVKGKERIPFVITNKGLE
jgi:predicted ATP-dependent serine protease